MDSSFGYHVGRMMARTLMIAAVVVLAVGAGCGFLVGRLAH